MSASCSPTPVIPGSDIPTAGRPSGNSTSIHRSDMRIRPQLWAGVAMSIHVAISILPIRIHFASHGGARPRTASPRSIPMGITAITGTSTPLATYRPTWARH